MMSAQLRKAALLAHVIASVGWLGAVAAFLAVAVIGLASVRAESIQAAYLSMEWITWGVVVPAAFASLLTGLISSLGTRWGLLRYYWVSVKLLVTPLSTLMLLAHLQPIETLARAALQGNVRMSGLHEVHQHMMIAAAAAVAVLLVLAGLSVYKPPGVTPYGARKLSERREQS